MSQETAAILGVAATLIGLFALWFFMSPKEQGSILSTRINTLEAAHQALALRFEGSHARHDESLENLTRSIDRLTQQIERLESHVVGKPARAR